MFDHPLYGLSMSNPFDTILRISSDVFPGAMLYDSVHSSDGQNYCEVK